MEDYLASLERLPKNAAEAALTVTSLADKAKQEFLDRLHRHLDQLADDVEQAMNTPKTV
jgi:hypothetical protein